MRSIAIIPSRMGASRFPGKPMAKIHGMPMIGHCFNRTRLCAGVFDTYVATCDKEIADYIEGIGGKSVMTSSTHDRATDRTAEAIMKIEEDTGLDVDVVVMVQGDEPILSPSDIDNMLVCFEDPSVNIVNVMSRIRTEEQFVDKNNVKVVVNQSNDAMYFSREPIPSPWKGFDNLPMYNQVGIIAFRKKALIDFNNMPQAEIEKIESIDMCRVLETGGNVRMVPTDNFYLGVDTKEELAAVEKLLDDDDLLKGYCSYERN